MQERAVAVVALLVAEKRRAILGGSVLSPQDPVAINGAIYRTNASRGIGLARERDINANSLVGVATGLGFADHDFLDITILSEILPSTKSLEQLVLVADRRIKADDIDQILLDNTNTRQVLPAGGFDLTFFGFLLLRRGCLAVF